jgi:hypothetical protein
MLGVLKEGSTAAQFDKLSAEMTEQAQALMEAKQKTAAWKEPLTSDDTENALTQAKAFEKSFFKIFQPAYWRLKKTVQSHYDFTKHAVAPPMTKVLGELAAMHRARAAFEATCSRAAKEWHADDAQTLLMLVTELRTSGMLAHKSVRALLKQLGDGAEAGTLMENLADIHARFAELDKTLSTLLSDHEQFDVPSLTEMLGKLREQRCWGNCASRRACWQSCRRCSVNWLNCRPALAKRCVAQTCC